MSADWKTVARRTLQGSETDSMTFPEGVKLLMGAGFDGYAVDFRRSVRTYYRPDGETFELAAAPTEPVAERFDAEAVNAAIREAQEHVHLRDGRDVTLAAMAAAAGLERRTFLRRFQSATGQTPIDYCRQVRIARAREFVEDGHLPLKGIAEKLGYADVSAFAKAFRRAYGTPPGLYRKERSPVA